MPEKKFGSVRQSIDVIDRDTDVVLQHFYYCPLMSGDYEVARDLASHFVRDRCTRHNFDVSSYLLVDHYHATCWILDK